jgi:hypothetical protein
MCLQRCRMTPQHGKGAVNVSSANLWQSAVDAEVEIGNQQEISAKPLPALGIGALVPEGLFDPLPIFRCTDLRLFRRLTRTSPSLPIMRRPSSATNHVPRPTLNSTSGGIGT